MADRFFCIHGHFYQPPRENPWLDYIEDQPSARPYHDWNIRITRECYAPNSRARVLGDQGRITRLINNYEYLSFNFGPTLLSWMQDAAPHAYEHILAADRVSVERCGGHGNALAQVYNHMIMPLATDRDKLTQVVWGMADFRHRFGREPEGMWLAETAADRKTLALLAKSGIKFTILAPGQAKRIRPVDAKGKPGAWVDVSGGSVDPRRAYRVYPGPAGTPPIDVYFYDGGTSQAVAFERLLSSGPNFLNRLKMAMGNPNGEARLANIATDGESYGHHFRFGEMALAWVLDQVENDQNDPNPIRVTNYAEFLALNPPEWEAEIIENTSWSCAHGVERWRSDCGCKAGHPEWNQKWRTPLRQGMDWLGDRLQGIFQSAGRELLKNPEAARNDYIRVVLDPSDESRRRFLEEHQSRPLSAEEAGRAWALLESQRMALFMFTSCGWFFDDIAGIEPIQNMKYAARAIDLAAPFSDETLEAGLLDFLALAKPNDPAYETGADVYRREAASSRMTPERGVSHFVIGRLVDEVNGLGEPVNRMVQVTRSRRLTAAGLTAFIGEAVYRPVWAGPPETRSFLSLHAGGADLSCVVGPAGAFDLPKSSTEVQEELEQASLLNIKSRYAQLLPGRPVFTIADLIPDVRGRVTRHLTNSVLSDLKRRTLEEYSINRDVFLMLRESIQDGPEDPSAIYHEGGRLEDLLDRFPHTVQTVDYAEKFIFHTVVFENMVGLMQKAGEVGQLDLEAFRFVISQADKWGVSPKDPTLSRLINLFLLHRFTILTEKADLTVIREIANFLKLIRETGREPELYEAQNTFDDLRRRPDYLKALTTDQNHAFEDLGRELGFLAQRDAGPKKS